MTLLRIAINRLHEFYFKEEKNKEQWILGIEPINCYTRGYIKGLNAAIEELETLAKTEGW